MQYQFPTIKHIDDVLPALEGRDEFIVAERPEDGYKVINYVVAFHDSFDIDVSNGYKTQHGEYVSKGVMRRECRGIIFDNDGNLISRPFHKFFNAGEKTETGLSRLPMNEYHTVMEKVDGSMIRPIVADMVNDFDTYMDQVRRSDYRSGPAGPTPKDENRWVAQGRNGWHNEVTYLQHVRMATKMGFTEIADMADKVVDHDLRKWMARILIEENATPLFEYVAPENRIVVNYNEAKLVLLAVRNNDDGEYWPRARIEYHNPPCDLVPVYGQVEGNINEYVARQKNQEGREGDVIQFNNGHMVKIKNDWYLRIHRVKDQISNDRRLLDLILNGEVDDILPVLDQEDQDRILLYDAKFQRAFKGMVKKLDTLSKEFKEKATMPNEFFEAEEPTINKKMVAVDLLPISDVPRKLYGVVFGFIDGKSTVYDAMLKRANQATSSYKKYNEFADLLGLAHTTDDLEEE